MRKKDFLTENKLIKQISWNNVKYLKLTEMERLTKLCDCQLSNVVAVKN